MEYRYRTVFTYLRNQDFFIEVEQADYKTKISLGNHHYFNNRVLLINMRRWRELNILEMSLTWLNKYKECYKVLGIKIS